MNGFDPFPQSDVVRPYETPGLDELRIEGTLGGWHSTPLGIVFLTPEEAEVYREQPCKPVTLGPPKQVVPKVKP